MRKASSTLRPSTRLADAGGLAPVAVRAKHRAAAHRDVPPQLALGGDEQHH
jgi:hypothetical protein